MSTKRCTGKWGCGEVLPVENFSKDRSHRTGLNNCCRKCQSKKVKEQRCTKKNKQYQMKSRYGITLTEYYTLLTKFGGLCEICGTQTIEHTAKRNGRAIDHNHKSGKVRGILCRQCNVGLGNFEDDIDRLKAAIRYLNENSDS